MMNKYELKQQLQGSVVSVVFTKADGTERTMRCTLLAEYLPAAEGAQLLTEGTRKENDDVLSVWDIENDGWRSFRLDSIKSVAVG
jgi:hypothetical protein